MTTGSRESVVRRSRRCGFFASADALRLALVAAALSTCVCGAASAADTGLPTAETGTLISGERPSIQPAQPESSSTTSVPQKSVSDGTDWLDPARISLTAGASAWSGNFGTTSSTTISAALLSASYAAGDLRLSATLPYTRISTNGDMFLGLGATPLIVRPQTAGPRRVNEGLGDLTFTSSYDLHVPQFAHLDLELLGGLKLPTASSSSHVSTGEVDVSFGGEVSRSFGRLVPFASVVYRDFGDSPLIKLHNGAATSVGLSYVVADRWVVNGSYDYARSASDFVADSHELVTSLSYKFLRTGLRLTAYASAGLSSGAPAVSGGLSLGARL